jgi:hypothetical protein
LVNVAQPPASANLFDHNKKSPIRADLRGEPGIQHGYDCVEADAQPLVALSGLVAPGEAPPYPAGQVRTVGVCRVEWIG